MEELKLLKQKDGFWLVLAILLAFMLSWPMFGPYYFQPNKYMFAYSGDPLVLYYDVAYHAAYDHSAMLTNMNYPDYEMVFLTDAQGALSTVLQFLNKFLPLKHYSIGFVNAINVYSFLFAVGFYFYILLALKMPKNVAWMFAPFIALISPQLSRIVPHHGLGNLAVIPLCILWVIRKYNVGRLEKRDAAIFLFLVFCCFNNPYIGFMSTTFLFFSFLGLSLIRKKVDRYFLKLCAVSILPLCLVFVFIKLFDPFAGERLKLQWGYFFFKSNFEGLFFAPNSVMGKIINLVTKKDFYVEGEADLTIYLFITIALIVSFIIYLFQKNKRNWFVLPVYMQTALFSSFLLFLYSSAIIFLPFNKEFVEEKLGFLLMFKAVARISWPFWNVLTLIGIAYLYKFTASLPKHGYQTLIPIILFSFYVEQKLHIGNSFENVRNDNMFSKRKQEELSTFLKTTNIKFEDFQAMLLLPKNMTWHDNFLSEISFQAQYNGMLISYNQNLPLISAMLSRISTRQLAERIEFIGNPLIEKSLQTKFPDKRKILILVGKDKPLKYGEQHLVDRSTLLYENNDYKFLAFDPFSINDNNELKLAKSKIMPDSLLQTNFVHVGFDNESSGVQYFGAGAHKVNSGIQEIGQYEIKNELDSLYRFSAWIHIDNERHGMGFWEVLVMDNNGIEVEKQKLEVRYSNDVHDDWIRSEAMIKVKNGHKVKVSLEAFRPLVIDEILIQPVSKHVVIQPNDRERLFDGFKIQLN